MSARKKTHMFTVDAAGYMAILETDAARTDRWPYHYPRKER